MRIDKNNRWNVGDKIHFWRGNPRNVTKNPYPLGTGVIDKIENIAMTNTAQGKLLMIIDGTWMCDYDIKQFAKADGFSSISYFSNFFFKGLPGHFEGRVLHWDYKKCEFYKLQEA